MDNNSNQQSGQSDSAFPNAVAGSVPMHRRDFLTRAAAAGLLSSCGPVTLLAAGPGSGRPEHRDKRHLLIAYTWGTADLGGIGILPGLLNLVRKAEPSLPTTVLTLQSRKSSSYEFLKGYLPGFLPGCRVLPNPFADVWGSTAAGSAWRSFCERWGEAKLRAFENGSLSARIAEQIAKDVLDRLSPDLFRQLERENPEAARAFAEAGFVLYSSGTTLNFGRAGQRKFWSSLMPAPLLVARALGIPYGINGQSFDAVEWPVDRIYRPLFRDARFVFCRDTDSLEYLRQRDLLCAHSGFRPDSTFFFNGRDEAWAEAFLRANGLEDGRFITVIGRFAESFGPISGAVAAERERQHLEKYKRLIEGWIEKTGLAVVICPEAKHEAPRLRKLLHVPLSAAAREKCVCMDSFWTPEQACSLYRRARIVVGHMHTIIFALAVGTPVLHIPYAEAGRKAWMVRDAGLGDWLFDIDETPAETLIEAALRIHHAHDAARDRVRQAMAEIERLGLEVMAEVKLGWRS